MLKIKDKVIGNGKPLVCVSVMDSEKDKIIEEVKRLVANGAEMIEWRVDAFSDVKNHDAVLEILQEVAPLTTKTIFIFTFRSKEQGGECSLSNDMIYELHQVVAESKVVDFIDIEYFAVENADEKICNLKNMGVKVIASHHDFHKTPSSDVLFTLLEDMKQGNVDIVKLAVMPNSTEDVLRLLTETNRFHERYPDQPLVTMSMGKLGVISRVAGETFGSCVTFGAGKDVSAPGQVEMSKLKLILDTLSGE